MARFGRNTVEAGKRIFRVVWALLVLDGALVVAILADGLVVHMAAADLLPFVLILVIATVPVALPATFTLATSLGALELARAGVLVTHLSAIEEAAAMDLLCTDKTGTITQNRLSVTAVLPYGGRSEADVLALAAAASDPGPGWLQLTEVHNVEDDRGRPAARSDRGTRNGEAMIVCVPVDADGAVDPRWGRAARVALATVEGDVVKEWSEVSVTWDSLHDTGGEGAHHARVARFLREHHVEAVVAHHMGAGMTRMLGTMGIAAHLGAAGDARLAVLSAVAS